MKSIDSIPTSKIQRASNILKTGAKVGGNYVKYYANRVTKSKDEANQNLNEDNAEDIYDGLNIKVLFFLYLQCFKHQGDVFDCIYNDMNIKVMLLLVFAMI